MTIRQTICTDIITAIKHVTHKALFLSHKRTFSTLVYIIDILGQIKTTNFDNNTGNSQPLSTRNNAPTHAIAKQPSGIQAGTRQTSRHARKHARAQKHTRPRFAGTPYLVLQCMSKTAEGVSDFGREIMEKGTICEGVKVLGSKKARIFGEGKKEKRGYCYNVNWGDIYGR